MSEFPPVAALHSFHFPLAMTFGYLLLISGLKWYLKGMNGESQKNIKEVLKPSVIIYNVFQVLVNGYIVWDICMGLIVRRHPFVGDVTATDCW